MRPCTPTPPAWRSREIFSAWVSEDTTPEEAPLPAVLGHSEPLLAACSSGYRGLGNSRSPAPSVPALDMEHFKDLSSAFQSVME